MPVFRVHKTTNYTVMSNQHFKDKRLSLKAKGLLSLMLSLPDDWDYSTQGLTTLSADGETAVRSGLQELEENGYLKRTPVREKGIIRDWQYDIYEMPKSLENITSEPDVENVHVDSPAQLNTNKVNTKEIDNSNSTNVELENPTTSKRTLIAVGIPNTANKPVKKKNLYEKCIGAIEEFTDESEIKSNLIVYLKVRLEMEQPLYFNQWAGYLKELRRLQSVGQNIRDVIQQSINRGYRGFYEVKRYTQSRGQDQSVFNEFGKVKTGKGAGGSLTNVQF